MEKEAINEFLKGTIKDLTFSSPNFDDKIVSTRVLDSISLVDLIVAIEDEYGITIQKGEIDENNFDTINNMSDLIIKKSN